MSQADTAAALKKACKVSTVEQRRLELQGKIDHKLHKNEQQWDDIAMDNKAMCFRTKQGRRLCSGTLCGTRNTELSKIGASSCLRLDLPLHSNSGQGIH